MRKESRWNRSEDKGGISMQEQRGAIEGLSEKAWHTRRGEELGRGQTDKQKSGRPRTV